MKRLDNKVAIVTGASKGIGAGIAKAFGTEGAAAPDLGPMLRRMVERPDLNPGKSFLLEGT